MYGSVAEKLVNTLAKYGRLTIEQCIQTTSQQEKLSKYTKLTKNHFATIIQLIKEYFIEKVPSRYDCSRKIFKKIPFISSKTQTQLKQGAHGINYSSFDSSKSSTFSKKKIEFNISTSIYFESLNPRLMFSKTLWRINLKKYSSILCQTKCSSFVATKYGKKKAHVLKLIINISKSNSISSMRKNSQSTIRMTVKESSIIREAIHLIKGAGEYIIHDQNFSWCFQKNLDIQRLSGLTSIFFSDRLHTIGVDLHKIHVLKKLTFTKRFVTNRFGTNALSLLSHLNTTDFKLEKKISETSEFKKNETYRILYRMLKAGFLNLNLDSSIMKPIQSKSSLLWKPASQHYKILERCLFYVSRNNYLKKEDIDSGKVLNMMTNQFNVFDNKILFMMTQQYLSYLIRDL
jgi:hypothetical protein